jgi:hypothetical protein
MKDLKSLSGGERSFTGVSFVLALGKEVRTPFFAMDEFDVFMDAVNRRVRARTRFMPCLTCHDCPSCVLRAQSSACAFATSSELSCSPTLPLLQSSAAQGYEPSNACGVEHMHQGRQLHYKVGSPTRAAWLCHKTVPASSA